MIKSGIKITQTTPQKSMGSKYSQKDRSNMMRSISGGNLNIKDYPQEYSYSIGAKRGSLKTNINQEPLSSSQAQIIGKDKSIKRIIAEDLKQQISSKLVQHKSLFLQKLEEEKQLLQMNKEAMQKQNDLQRRRKQQSQKQIVMSYQQKIRKIQQDHKQQEMQKRRFHQIYKVNKFNLNQLSQDKGAQNANTKAMPVENIELTKPSHKQQLQNKSGGKINYNSKSKMFDKVIEERIKQSKIKSDKMEIQLSLERRAKKEELYRTLQQQVKQNEKKRQAQKAYDKSTFYKGKYQNVYNPLYNPIDSKFCKDNKYIYGQLEHSNTRINPESPRGQQPSSELARKGSRTLL